MYVYLCLSLFLILRNSTWYISGLVLFLLKCLRDVLVSIFLVFHGGVVWVSSFVGW